MARNTRSRRSSDTVGHLHSGHRSGGEVRRRAGRRRLALSHTECQFYVVPGTGATRPTRGGCSRGRSACWVTCAAGAPHRVDMLERGGPALAPTAEGALSWRSDDGPTGPTSTSPRCVGSSRTSSAPAPARPSTSRSGSRSRGSSPGSRRSTPTGPTTSTSRSSTSSSPRSRARCGCAPRSTASSPADAPTSTGTSASRSSSRRRWPTRPPRRRSGWSSRASSASRTCATW